VINPAAVLFDVDGVLLETPQYEAWLAAAAEMRTEQPAGAPPVAEVITREVYQRRVAGRGRADSARTILHLIGLGDAGQPVLDHLSTRKQVHFLRLVEEGAFAVFPDAVEYALAWRRSVRLAAASASRNADLLLRRARYGARRGPVRELFEVCVAGTRPDKRGLFTAAAAELGVPAAECLVVEDAPTGVAAAVSLGAATLGVARPPADPGILRAAGAGWVVADLAAAPRPEP